MEEGPPEGMTAQPGGQNQELNSSVSQTLSALETKRRDSSKTGWGREGQRGLFSWKRGLRWKFWGQDSQKGKPCPEGTKA